jgi:hypothetical protein
MGFFFEKATEALLVIKREMGYNKGITDTWRKQNLGISPRGEATTIGSERLRLMKKNGQQTTQKRRHNRAANYGNKNKETREQLGKPPKHATRSGRQAQQQVGHEQATTPIIFVVVMCCHDSTLAVHICGCKNDATKFTSS